ncbi:acyl-coenzyme A thioesterase 13-like [Papaver somniferum]|uniref:acyl-coenzyme A thioesterase 13-like n=1 Tax=Papaver somniferum TaxID=3469 RepID=UPI000E6F466A|nr:acyl-coenzyme A thioesterase 13-like [Papaver somniferum]
MAKDWIQSLAQGRQGREIETQALQNLYSVHVLKGLIQCNFISEYPKSYLDGNWHVGAIATLIDIAGASAIVTVVGNINVSVDFSISYFSPAKIDEEVEIEAKVLGRQGNLSSNMVVIKNKENGELTAVGKQWMSAFDLKHKSKL